mmetsp:Transcript_30783/g.42116  ORF Transcript_30783/g.42116 Transcript_30783/m.42116 type:complete len:720 (+) Transcript_30783:37-2196(+)
MVRKWTETQLLLHLKEITRRSYITGNIQTATSESGNFAITNGVKAKKFPHTSMNGENEISRIKEEMTSNTVQNGSNSIVEPNEIVSCTVFSTGHVDDKDGSINYLLSEVGHSKPPRPSSLKSTSPTGAGLVDILRSQISSSRAVSFSAIPEMNDSLSSFDVLPTIGAEDSTLLASSNEELDIASAVERCVGAVQSSEAVQSEHNRKKKKSSKPRKQSSFSPAITESNKELTTSSELEAKGANLQVSSQIMMVSVRSRDRNIVDYAATGTTSSMNATHLDVTDPPEERNVSFANFSLHSQDSATHNHSAALENTNRPEDNADDPFVVAGNNAISKHTSGDIHTAAIIRPTPLTTVDLVKSSSSHHFHHSHQIDRATMNLHGAVEDHLPHEDHPHQQHHRWIRGIAGLIPADSFGATTDAVTCEVNGHQRAHIMATNGIASSVAAHTIRISFIYNEASHSLIQYNPVNHIGERRLKLLLGLSSESGASSNQQLVDESRKKDRMIYFVGCCNEGSTGKGFYFMSHLYSSDQSKVAAKKGNGFHYYKKSQITLKHTDRCEYLAMRSATPKEHSKKKSRRSSTGLEDGSKKFSMSSKSIPPAITWTFTWKSLSSSTHQYLPLPSGVFYHVNIVQYLSVLDAKGVDVSMAEVEYQFPVRGLLEDFEDIYHGTFLCHHKFTLADIELKAHLRVSTLIDKRQEAYFVVNDILQTCSLCHGVEFLCTL